MEMLEYPKEAFALCCVGHRAAACRCLGADSDRVATPVGLAPEPSPFNAVVSMRFWSGFNRCNLLFAITPKIFAWIECGDRTGTSQACRLKDDNM